MFSSAPTSPRRPPGHRGALLERPGDATSRRAPRSYSILSVARRYIPTEWVGEPEEERDEYRHGRPGKLDGDRYLLRGSRLGQARRVGPRVAAERCFLGE